MNNNRLTNEQQEKVQKYLETIEAASLDMMTFFAALEQGKARGITAECTELLKDYQDVVSDIIKAVVHIQVTLGVGRSQQTEVMNHDDHYKCYNGTVE